MIIRAKYKRGRKLKYISHLNIMKVFERAIRRAQIPVSYSQGFNRRPKLVFSMALSVGLETRADYFDIELDKKMNSKRFKDELNQFLPKGLKVLEANEGKYKKNIMSEIAYAKYELVYSEDDNILKKAYDKMMDEDELIIEKRKKGKIKTKDIKKGIKGVKIKDKTVNVVLNAGQNNNVKPEEFAKKLNDSSGLSFEVEHIVRSSMYLSDEEGNFLDPVSKEIVDEKDIY